MVKKALVAVVKQKMCFPEAGKGGRIPVKKEICGRERSENMLLAILILCFVCWASNIQYIDGKWVNVKKLEKGR